jgi:ATP-dependent RNA helicase SUPV3L1/SUV3
VMGALSPRTRNAQVELYQNGDVEYLVATDAIGMGLNLDVDHVAFAQDRKFDGYQFRPLNPGEMAQIAGRAGRHLRNGTFGVTGRVDPFDGELVERIETHQFDPIKVLQWRTKQLDFSSITALQSSLEAAPAVQGLSRAFPAVDQQALEYLSRYPEIRDVTKSAANVEKLWEVCALPDYRRITPAQHADLISSLYFDLVKKGTVNEDFIAEQIRRADRTDGEIDTLSARIAQIRTWTYVSNRPGWLANPTHWQEKTREIEDRLSDALHDRLTKRFVDRRTSVLMRRLRENAMLEAEISVNGDVFVEGHHVGQLAGFRFSPVAGGEGPDAKAVQGAAQKALALEYEARAARLHASANGDLALTSDGLVRWMGDPVARLAAGDNIMKPRVIMLADEQLTGAAREHSVARVERFVNHQIATVLKPLDDISRAEDLQGLAKGLAFQLVENLGVLFRRDVAEEVKTLDQDARASMRRYGVRFGAYHVFLPALLKPAPAELVTLLWALKNDGLDKPGYGELIPVLAAGRTSVVTDAAYERTFYKLAGFRFLGKRAVRIDILERLADLIRPLLQWKPGTQPRPEGAYDGRRFTTTTAMLSILGATLDDMEEILKGLGYRADQVSAEDAAKFLASQAPATEASAEGEATEAPAQEAAAAAEAVDAPVVAVDAVEGEATEPKPVLLWRPAGRNEGQRNEGRRPNNQRPARAPAAAGEREQQGERRRDREGNQAPRNNDRKREGQRSERPHGDKRNDRDRGNERHGKPNAGQQRFEAKAPRKEKPMDPDSPFAKLAALKDQLKK